MLVKNAVLPLVAAYVLALAELVLDHLISVMLFVPGDPPVVLVVVIVLETDADLLSIPTVARRGSLPLCGRACGACGSRCTRCRIRGGARGIRRSRGAGSGAG